MLEMEAGQVEIELEMVASQLFEAGQAGLLFEMESGQ